MSLTETLHIKSADRDALSVRAHQYPESDPRRLRALIDLAVSYWQTGEFEEALVFIDQALFEEDDPVIHFDANRIKAVILSQNGEQDAALRILSELDPDKFPAELRGRFYGQRGYALASISKSDLALLDYAGAYQFFVDAGNEVYAAAVKNNVARCMRDAGRYRESHENSDEAIAEFTRLDEPEFLGQSLDQKAQTYLQEGKLRQAAATAERAIAILETCERPSCLAEALITYGKILARQKKHSDARSQLERAGAICEQTGHREMAGLAYLTVLEELPLPAFEKAAMYSDPIRVFRARSGYARNLSCSPTRGVIDLAMKRADNVYRQAAPLLGVSYQALVKAAKKNGLDVKPKHRRRKTRFKNNY